MKKKIFIWLFLIICWIENNFATDCVFDDYKIDTRSVFWIIECDNSIDYEIPFADIKTFHYEKGWVAQDINYIYNQWYVAWRSDNIDFDRLNNIFYTDYKNIFLKYNDLYIFLDKYVQVEFFEISSAENNYIYLVKTNNNLYKIYFNNKIFSYISDIQKITNIDKIEFFTSIADWLYYDGNKIYTSISDNISHWEIFWYKKSTAELLHTQNPKILRLYNLFTQLSKIKLSEKHIENYKDVYKKLENMENPYSFETQKQLYIDFFIFKKLVLDNLKNILK